MTGWPWRIVVRWALLDTRAPCELAWTWCTLACWESGDNMTHCYLTLAPKLVACRGRDRGSTPLTPVSDGCMVTCQIPLATRNKPPGATLAYPMHPRGSPDERSSHTLKHCGMPGTVRGPVLCNTAQGRDTSGQDIPPSKIPRAM